MQLIVNITKQIPNASERFPNTDYLGDSLCTSSLEHFNQTKHNTRHFDNIQTANKTTKTTEITSC